MEKHLSKALERLQDAVATAHDTESFKQAATQFAEAAGYNWFSFFTCERRTRILSNQPTEWVREYMAEDLSAIDPRMHRACSLAEPFRWNGAKDAANAEEQRFFSRAASYGVKSGVVVPVPIGSGRRVGFAVSGEGSEPVAAVPGFQTALRSAAVFFAAFFHASGARFDLAQSALTPRETEVLIWISKGLTINEIAGKLGISPRTMLHHTVNIRTKLKAATLPQAVRNAIELNALKV